MAFVFVFVSARTQHCFATLVANIIFRLAKTSFHLWTQNDVTHFGVNDVAFGKQCCASHKWCGLTPNDVALRANGLATPPLLCYNKQEDLYKKKGELKWDF